jgi:hypothetical protein
MFSAEGTILREDEGKPRTLSLPPPIASVQNPKSRDLWSGPRQKTSLASLLSKSAHVDDLTYPFPGFI